MLTKTAESLRRQSIPESHRTILPLLPVGIGKSIWMSCNRKLMKPMVRARARVGSRVMLGVRGQGDGEIITGPFLPVLLRPPG